MEQFIKDGRFHCHTSNSNKDSFMTERQLVSLMNAKKQESMESREWKLMSVNMNLKV